MLPDLLDSNSVLPWEAKTDIKPAPTGAPGVSIVIPIFNAGKFLEKTIRSVLCNDLGGVELIVMDGGSTDGTGKILEHYREYFTVCVSEKDGGQSDAINKGFRRASQPILYWLNGDDLILPNTLRSVRKVFQDSDQTQVVVGDAYMTEVDLTPIRHFRFSADRLRFDYLIDYAAHHLIQPSVFFSRKAWDECGPVAQDLHYAMDADLFLAMSARYEFVHLPIDIAYSVYHEDCKTRGKRAESITELSLVQARHGGLDHARKTLNILIDMFNATSDELKALKQQSPESKGPCPECEINRRKVHAIEEELERKKKLLLTLDMEAL